MKRIFVNSLKQTLTVITFVHFRAILETRLTFNAFCIVCELFIYMYTHVVLLVNSAEISKHRNRKKTLAIFDITELAYGTWLFILMLFRRLVNFFINFCHILFPIFTP